MNQQQQGQGRGQQQREDAAGPAIEDARLQHSDGEKVRTGLRERGLQRGHW